MLKDVFDAYATSSDRLITRFEAMSSAQLLEPVIDLLPAPPSRIADIGAGTGRDAAWLTAKGYRVSAVEPVDELRCAGMKLHSDLPIEWLSDSLPDLSLLRLEDPFDAVLLIAVWHHLAESERKVAMRNLTGIIKPGGLAIMSLRHGNTMDGLVHSVPDDETIAMAEQTGFEVVRVRQSDSVQAENQAANIYWTWLTLRLS